MLFRSTATLLLLLFTASALPAQEAVLEPDSVNKDYAGELPRIPPTSPTDALARFQIADGFKIELAAHEPLITDPIAMAFDEWGDLYVVCMRDYSEHPDDRLGVIRKLEDSDHDGVFDRATNFVTGLSWPTAVACYDGGVFVGAPPEILYCKDTDGDGVADKQRVVFSGFGRQNVQGMLNSFRWGIDNLLYGSAGTNGGLIASLDEPDRDPVRLRGKDFRIDPGNMRLSAISGGAQHGATFDRWGERFVCSNSNHVQWIEYEQKYLDANPLLGAGSRRSIAVDGPAAEVFRTSPVEPWRIVRTRLRVKKMVGGPVEGGGRSSGYFTSASGITVYSGDAFDQRYRDGCFVFVGDVGSNLVHLKTIETDGLTRRARRALPGEQEFLTSTDNWFRPVQFACGPDGALYVIDMYREVIEHPLSLPPMIKKHLDLDSGRDRGRIYRVSPLGWRQPQRPLPGDVDGKDLVEMLSHENGWHRETAARLIVTQTRQRPSLTDRYSRWLEQQCQTSTNPLARIRAANCLSTLGSLTFETLSALMRDAHPQVRIASLRLAEQHPEFQDELRSHVRQLAKDPEIAVRYQLALSLCFFDSSDREPILRALVQDDFEDPKMRIAIQLGMGKQRIEMLSMLLEFSPVDAALLSSVIDQIARDRRDVGRAVDLLAQSSAAASRIDRLLQRVGLRGARLETFLREQDVDPSILRSRLDGCRSVAMDRDQPAAQRVRAVRTLCLGDYDDIAEALKSLLEPDQPRSLRNEALRQLSRFESIDATQTVIEHLDTALPATRHEVLDQFLARTPSAKKLIEAVQGDRLSPTLVSARHRQRLREHRDSSVAAMANSMFASNSDRQDLITQMSSVLDESGDPSRGERLFQKHCATCHRLEGQGHDVGPDLQPLRNRGAAFMLTNILDPNREVDPRYESSVVLTSDGRVETGILKDQNELTVTLIQADDRIMQIDHRDVEQLRSTGRSIMPEGLEQDLSRKDLADLLAFLVHPVSRRN